MRTRWPILFLSICITILILVLIYKDQHKKQIIFVLHSYNTDYSWVNGIDEGIKRVQFNKDKYDFVWHYMDAKKSTNKEFLIKAGNIARESIDRLNPILVIAMDDEAQEYVAKYYVDNPNITLVFGGINGSIKSYGYDKAVNTTGILELRQLNGLKEVITLLDKNVKGDTNFDANKIRIAYILDTSKPVLGDRGYIDNYSWEPFQYIGSYAVSTYEEWQKSFLGLEGKVDYIFVTNYRQLKRSAKDTTFVPPTEVMSWTYDHSPVPVVGLQVFNVTDGAMLAIGTSPYEQGEEAAKMALNILEKGIKVASMPPKENLNFIVAMRKSLLDKKGLKLNPVYESFSKSNNNYYE